MEYPVSHLILETFPSLSKSLYGLPAWYWVSMIVAFIIAIAIARFIRAPLSHSLAWLFRQREGDRRLFVDNLNGPILVLSTIAIFVILSFFIKDPKPEDTKMSFAIKLALFLGVTYLFYRLIDFASYRLLQRSTGPRSRLGLVLPLARRVAKCILIVVAFLMLLSQFGVDVSAFLVGLGVGGLAIALAAQKILENLFGGAVLSLDQPFKVGDYCQCGDIVGYIEEIGIRSTRIRTLDRTLITIPNSQLSEMHIENYMEREKIRLYTMLRLELGTPMEKIKTLLKECERILLENKEFYHDVYRVRLMGLSDYAYEIEIIAFARSTDVTEFARIREGLMMSYIEKLNELDIKLAGPSALAFMQSPSRQIKRPGYN